MTDHWPDEKWLTHLESFSEHGVTNARATARRVRIMQARLAALTAERDELQAALLAQPNIAAELLQVVVERDAQYEAVAEMRVEYGKLESQLAALTATVEQVLRCENSDDPAADLHAIYEILDAVRGA